VREVQALKIVNADLANDSDLVNPSLNVNVETLADLESIPEAHPWVLQRKLVCKSDQLVKRRAKSGLITVNSSWDEVKAFVNKFINKEFTVGGTTGILKTFIITPFIPHQQSEEAYICIYSVRDKDVILFCHEGGIDIGNVEDKATTLEVPVGTAPSVDDIKSKLLAKLDDSKKSRAAIFVQKLYAVYVARHFTYLEINPLVITDEKIYILDLAAKLDSAADYLFANCPVRGNISYPPPFGREATPEEAKIVELDGKTSDP